MHFTYLHNAAGEPLLVLRTQRFSFQLWSSGDDYVQVIFFVGFEAVTLIFVYIFSHQAKYDSSKQVVLPILHPLDLSLDQKCNYGNMDISDHCCQRIDLNNLKLPLKII